jgi:hypothetical protein
MPQELKPFRVCLPQFVWVENAVDEQTTSVHFIAAIRV